MASDVATTLNRLLEGFAAPGLIVGSTGVFAVWCLPANGWGQDVAVAVAIAGYTITGVALLRVTAIWFGRSLEHQKAVQAHVVQATKASRFLENGRPWKWTMGVVTLIGLVLVLGDRVGLSESETPVNESSGVATTLPQGDVVEEPAREVEQPPAGGTRPDSADGSKGPPTDSRDGN